MVKSSPNAFVLHKDLLNGKTNEVKSGYAMLLFKCKIRWFLRFKFLYSALLALLSISNLESFSLKMLISAFETLNIADSSVSKFPPKHKLRFCRHLASALKEPFLQGIAP